MAGQPILMSYLEKIDQADIGKILDQIAEGYRISEIAPQLGVSRAFLSCHLNATALGRECLALAREISQRTRKHGHVSRMCAPLANGKRDEMQGWLAARLSPANRDASGGVAVDRASHDHLAALRSLMAERSPTQ